MPNNKLPNLICTLPGSEVDIIVVAARLDFKSHGDEERVDWATLELLPLLAESLNSSPHRCTLVFAAFTGHDHDFTGSTLYLKSLTEDHLKNLRGMIFLDHLGRVPPNYAHPMPDTSRIASVGTRAIGFQEGIPDSNVLTVNAGPAADALKLPRPPRNNGIAATDARIFAEARVLAINFQSAAYTTLLRFDGTGVRVMRTDLDPAVYNDTYNLLCAYVLLVDKALDAACPQSLPQSSDQQPPAH